jgi:hypothetical protein
MKMSKKQLTGLALGAMLMANQLGQGQWCWVSRTSGGDARFCDYTSFGACLDANQNKQGTCVPKSGGGKG